MANKKNGRQRATRLQSVAEQKANIVVCYWSSNRCHRRAGRKRVVDGGLVARTRADTHIHRYIITLTMYYLFFYTCYIVTQPYAYLYAHVRRRLRVRRSRRAFIVGRERAFPRNPAEPVFFCFGFFFISFFFFLNENGWVGHRGHSVVDVRRRRPF